ncbi:MAG TPA: hypothetical protein VHN11_16390, partial [Xanthobacteraceae bacterium]|nr:hypothetical protein [Xanthobacteraceae bacterium]
MSLSRFGMLSSFAQNDVVAISFVSWELFTVPHSTGNSNTGEDGMRTLRMGAATVKLLQADSWLRRRR